MRVWRRRKEFAGLQANQFLKICPDWSANRIQHMFPPSRFSLRRRRQTLAEDEYWPVTSPDYPVRSRISRVQRTRQNAKDVLGGLFLPALRLLRDPTNLIHARLQFPCC